jgi:hypothetical protein
MSVRADGQKPASQLFTLRLWDSRADDGSVEWRGKIQHVMSGEAHYFRDWAMLLDLLLTMLQSTESQGEGEAPGRGDAAEEQAGNPRSEATGRPT